ncbi:right-handed parallel beta-helix repeat-containing protein [Methanococcoides methylutens]|uniref:right-handed parallel beta-helix repeat-containing protein n=1 Tax=Methanococcoides methylutens TaxID=2226 RepID=UPI004044FE16
MMRKPFIFLIILIVLLISISTTSCFSSTATIVYIDTDGHTVSVKNENGYVIYEGIDDVAAIEVAMNDLSDGGIIFFKKGMYNIDRTVFLKSNISFIGNDDVIIKCFDGIAFHTGSNGYSPSAISLSNDAHSSDTEIEMSSIIGLSVGDSIKISDDFSIFDQGHYYKNGELAKIIAIDGTTITIDRPLYDNYTKANNAKIRQISMFENIKFENIDFVGYGIETNSAAIYLYGAKNCTISNCEFTGFGDRVINLWDCLDCVVERNVFKNNFKTGTGYGVALVNACDNITIINNSFLEKGRHYIAVGGGIETKISDGLCRNVSVINNIFENSTDEAINTHAPTKSMFRVVDNEFFNCLKGIEFSNSDSLITNNTFVNCTNAIETYGTGNHIIKSNYFQENNLIFTQGNLEGTHITTYEGKSYPAFQGNFIPFIPNTSSIIRSNLCNNGGYIRPKFNVVINDNTFTNYTNYFIYSQGSDYGSNTVSNITISNNICEDELTTAIKLVYCRDIFLINNDLKGDVEFGKCSDVRIIDNQIISSKYGVRVWNAEGAHTIISNELKADIRGISLENMDDNPITEEIIISNNAINAPVAVYNNGYSNVIIEEGPTAGPVRKPLTVFILLIILLIIISTTLCLSSTATIVYIDTDGHTVSVKDENGTVIYGGTDDVAAIEAAMNDLNDGGIIFFKKGMYNIDRTVFLKSNISFIGNDEVIIKCFDGLSFYTGSGGYSSSAISLSNDAHSSDTEIEMSSIIGLSVGDSIKISDDFSIFDQGHYYKNGELAKIIAIDGTTITIDRPLYDNYTKANNAKIRQISMFENIKFDNIDFIGAGIESDSNAIWFSGARECKIINCSFTQFGSRATTLWDCLDCGIENNTFGNIFKTGAGYSVRVVNACDNITIINNSFLELGRHYICITGGKVTVMSDGLSRNLIIENNFFEYSTAESINSHAPNRATLRIDNNEFSNCYKGIELSNSSSIITNNTFVGCSNAIETYGTGNHIIKSNYFQENNLIFTQGNLEGTHITTYEGKSYPAFQGNFIPFIPNTSSIIRSNLCNNGGYIRPKFNVVINDNTFTNYTNYFIYSQGSDYGSNTVSNITISNNICEDELIIPIKLVYARDICLMNNDLKGYIEFRNCGNVRVIGNQIDSLIYCGLRVLDAEGTYIIKSNELKSNRRGISLENTGQHQITEEVLISNNAINAPVAVYNNGYSNVIIEEGPTAGPNHIVLPMRQ